MSDSESSLTVEIGTATAVAETVAGKGPLVSGNANGVQDTSEVQEMQEPDPEPDEVEEIGRIVSTKSSKKSEGADVLKRINQNSTGIDKRCNRGRKSINQSTAEFNLENLTVGAITNHAIQEWVNDWEPYPIVSQTVHSPTATITTASATVTSASLEEQDEVVSFVPQRGRGNGGNCTGMEMESEDTNICQATRKMIPTCTLGDSTTARNSGISQGLASTFVSLPPTPIATGIEFQQPINIINEMDVQPVNQPIPLQQNLTHPILRSALNAISKHQIQFPGSLMQAMPRPRPEPGPQSQIRPTSGQFSSLPGGQFQYRSASTLLSTPTQRGQFLIRPLQVRPLSALRLSNTGQLHICPPSTLSQTGQVHFRPLSSLAGQLRPLSSLTGQLRQPSAQARHILIRQPSAQARHILIRQPSAQARHILIRPPSVQPRQILIRPPSVQPRQILIRPPSAPVGLCLIPPPSIPGTSNTSILQILLASGPLSPLKQPQTFQTAPTEPALGSLPIENHQNSIGNNSDGTPLAQLYPEIDRRLRAPPLLLQNLTITACPYIYHRRREPPGLRIDNANSTQAQMSTLRRCNRSYCIYCNPVNVPSQPERQEDDDVIPITLSCGFCYKTYFASEELAQHILSHPPLC